MENRQLSDLYVLIKSLPLVSRSSHRQGFFLSRLKLTSNNNYMAKVNSKHHNLAE